jgi:cytochrome c oxidase cbb3-type subunit 3
MVVINLILLGVLFYMRRMFKEFLSMVRAEKTAIEEAPAAIKKINQVLTDAVPIEEEHTILMQHEYDGIRELDNNLPPWWVWGFYATIIFAVVYLFNYHILGTADLQTEEYNKEIAQAKKDVDAYLAKMAMNVDETNATLMTEAKDLSAGKALFETNCVTCHNPKGEGNIGPNLTDNFWIYGPDVKDLFKTVKLGTPNGMPEHASKMNPIQLQQVSSYVLSLPFTKGPKGPEGKEYPETK